MARVPEQSIEAFYRHVLSGKAKSQRERIMRYILRVGRPVTRHEIIDRFFFVGHPPRALDGGSPIRWNSGGPRIRELLDAGYIKIAYKGDDPVTEEPNCEFLEPVTELENPDQMRFL